MKGEGVKHVLHERPSKLFPITGRTLHDSMKDILKQFTHIVRENYDQTKKAHSCRPLNKTFTDGRVVTTFVTRYFPQAGQADKDQS